MPMPKYETKTEWTANQIRDAILGGRIRPGDRIRIQDWSKRLAVSATPIREALKALEAEGYVRISAHRGAEVTAFSSKEFSDSYRIQLALDSLATEFAVQRLNGQARTAACKRMRNMNEELREALRAGDSRRAEKLNADFHKAIYDAADSPLLTKARGPLWTGVPVAGQVFWEDVASSEDRIAELCDEHDGIVGALESGDQQLAMRLTRQHLESGINKLMALEKKPEPSTNGHRGARGSRRRTAAAAPRS
jgi:DNA-binding GntR family transcriptional regulator